MPDDPAPDDLPPAYFLSLTLENVRCFGPEQTLDLSGDDGSPAQWTVLLGHNGTGKTTLLQAIAASEPHEIRVRGTSNEKSPTITVPRIFRGVTWLSREHHRSEFSMYGQVGFGNLHSKPERKGKFEIENRPETHSTVTFEPSEVYSLLCYGYGASRHMKRSEITEMSDAFENRIATLFSEESALNDATEWMIEADYARKREVKDAEDYLSKVTSALTSTEKGVLPDVDGLRFSEREEGYARPRVEFHTPYGWVTIDQLSLGYRTMIAWVVDLARRLFERYPESDNPLAEPAVCLVDEIDLHLHPRWQRKIIDFLSERFPNTQFVVTAHSPLVVQAAQDANIALLKRVGVEDGDDYVEIHNDMEPVGNLRVDQILTSDLYGLESARPPQLDDLLEERRKILEQSELTEEDEKRLDEIEQKIGDLPSGETKEQRDAMEFIERVADRLENEKEPSS